MIFMTCGMIYEIGSTTLRVHSQTVHMDITESMLGSSPPAPRSLSAAAWYSGKSSLAVEKSLSYVMGITWHNPL